MALPKLNVPVYETILPSTDKVIKYRPFLVKEEKILLTALEDKTEKSLPLAIKQIINNCVQGEIDVEKLPSFDIEFLFLRLRAKSVGENVSVGLKPWGCPQNDGNLCENSTQVDINLEEVKVIKDELHTNKIMLDDTIGIVMDYPTTASLSGLEGGDEFTLGMNHIKSGIKMIFTKEETHEKGSYTEKELEEFIESLNSEQFQKVKGFYDTMPVLKHTVKYKCGTCGEEKETILEGMNSFFGSA
jgi:hypothetical protein|tara:strand:- start:562 stop:1293 length:732 start_codon:yes stop_codon:yes gene_type:complete